VPKIFVHIMDNSVSKYRRSFFEKNTFFFLVIIFVYITNIVICDLGIFEAVKSTGSPCTSTENIYKKNRIFYNIRKFFYNFNFGFEHSWAIPD